MQDEKFSAHVQANWVVSIKTDAFVYQSEKDEERGGRGLGSVEYRSQLLQEVSR